MFHSRTHKLSDSRSGRPQDNKTLSETLLSKDDPNAVTILNPEFLDTNNILIICDHASRTIPRKLNNLGLSQQDLNKHIAVDIGTDKLGRYIGKALQASVILPGFSRLVMDLNRDPNCKTSIPKISDNIEIPGNKNLSASQKKSRFDEIYTPYHNEISTALKRIKINGRTPLIISLHSFTPEMDGIQRQTDIGILWEKNKRISHKVMKFLKAVCPGATVDENVPYSLLDAPELNHTIIHHNMNAEDKYLLFEIRQDLLSDDTGVKKYGDILATALNNALSS